VCSSDLSFNYRGGNPPDNLYWSAFPVLQMVWFPALADARTAQWMQNLNNSVIPGKTNVKKKLALI